MKERNISRLTTAVAGAGLILSGAHTIKESIDFFDLADKQRNTEYGSMQGGSRLIGLASYGLIFAPAPWQETAPREKICIKESTNNIYFTAPAYASNMLSEGLTYLGNTSSKNSAIVYEIKDIRNRVIEDSDNETRSIQSEHLNKKVNPDCRIDEQKRLNEITEQIMKQAENVKSDEDESLQKELQKKLISTWKSQFYVLLFVLLWRVRKYKNKKVEK